MTTAVRHVLCIEDHEDTCLLIAALLEPLNYEVTSVSTAAEGLKLAQGGGFDLYLIDSRFPDGTGLELCRQIRQLDTHTPILFYSGDADEAHCQQALRAGAQGYLIKPEGFDHLEATITRLIADRRTRSAGEVE